MLNSIKTLKRYCKVTLNVFLKEICFYYDKKIYLHDKIFMSNQSFTA